MDFTQLEYFKVVALSEHMTQAANELHISQPALSKMISRLEDDLGVKLFDRDGKRIHLNAYGKMVLEYIDVLFKNYDELKMKINDLQDGDGGKIVVSSSFPSREPNWILNSIRSFLTKHDKVHLSLIQQNVKQMPTALENRTVDIAISSSPIMAPNIVWKELFVENMGIIVSVNHPLAAKEKISMNDLAGVPFLSNNANSDIQDLTQLFCETAGFKPNIYFEGDFPSFIGEAVSKGLGISVISESGFSRNATKPKIRQPWEDLIVYRPLQEDYCKRTCGIAYLKDRYFPKAAQDFYQHLIYHFQNERVDIRNEIR